MPRTTYVLPYCLYEVQHEVGYYEYEVRTRYEPPSERNPLFVDIEKRTFSQQHAHQARST